VEKRLVSLEKEIRTGDKQKIKDSEILKTIKENLDKNILIINLGEIAVEPVIKELNLLTAKKVIYLLNGKPDDVGEELKNKIRSLNADYLIIDLANASDIGVLIKKAYDILGLISFFTTGEDETRAWTIKKESKAPQAAGEIHSDFEKKFIRAETINWQKLLAASEGASLAPQGRETDPWHNAKQKGWLRIEGKDYIVQEGDVMVIRHG
jgi:ribosome-binding ATPase YchF (GTP1/OBG family)